MNVTQPQTDAPDRPAGSRFVSLNRAARRLGLDPKFTKGAAVSIGIRLEPAGNAIVMTEDDFQRLALHLAGWCEARTVVGAN